MSWQGNECFVSTVNYQYNDDHKQQMYILRNMLELYDEKGDGWYLLGRAYGDGCDDRDDFGLFEPKSFSGSAPSCACWMPNPFMAPGVVAICIRRASDVLEAAFEMWDSHLDVAAYAGDGSRPLQRIEVYGKVHDFSGMYECAK